jgi:uncharacterized protein with GYD domain
MPKYLFRAHYVGQGLEGLLKEGGSARREAAAKVISSVGGKLECFYFAFGEDDVIGVFDVPDVATAAAVSLRVNSSGSLVSKLTPLITPEEVDVAAKEKVPFRPPGQ